MEEVKIVYEVILDVWKLCKKYNCQKLSEKEWEAFVEEGSALHGKYQEKGKDVETLYRSLFYAIQEYYIRKNYSVKGVTED